MKPGEAEHGLGPSFVPFGRQDLVTLHLDPELPFELGEPRLEISAIEDRAGQSEREAHPDRAQARLPGEHDLVEPSFVDHDLELTVQWPRGDAGELVSGSSKEPEDLGLRP
ncbi:MAG: hypothetical protein HC923_05465 [Myxococcales bacterium]|nr:hypothetical protein [Myxococcales bacterium]